MATTAQIPVTPSIATVRLGHSPNKPRKKAVWQWNIVRRAIWDAFAKLDPRKMMGNPVMFVVEIGSVITTALLLKGAAGCKFNL
jgi:potassium-transporting ATPase ATP-binding subunit